MKKISYLLVVSMLFVTLFYICASADVYLAEEGFENTTIEAVRTKYRLSGETTGMKSEIVPGGQASSKAIKFTKRPAHWAGFRIPAWTEKVPDDMKPETVGKYLGKTGTAIIDFNKTYTMDFFVKFAGDIDKISVQFCWYYDDGTYGYIELFSTDNVGEEWTNMHSTFKLADEFKSSANAGLKEKVTKLPHFAEISILAGESASDMYVDNVVLVEGRTIPDKTGTPSTASKSTPSKAASTTPAKVSSSASAAANPSGNASISSGDADNSGLNVSISNQSVDNFFDDEEISSKNDDGGDKGGEFPIWAIGAIAGVVVLGAGGCMLYLKVFKKK